MAAKRRSGTALRDISRNKMAVTGLSITFVVLLLVTFGPLFSPYDPAKMVFTEMLREPSWAHPFGTDSYGRDVLIRALYGARVSLTVSFAGVALGGSLGIAIGMAAAYVGRFYDMALMRCVDLLFAFPSFILAMILMFVFGGGVVSVIMAIAVIYMPSFARLSRNMTMLVKNEPYIEAARLMGQSPVRIMAAEILPNISAPLIVSASAAVAFAIIIEAGLSFLGLGIQPPTPTLGGIMSDGKDYFQRAPWVLTMTGLTISFTLLGLNLVGDGIRDFVDPRLKRGVGL